MTTKQYHVHDLIAMIDNCNPFPNENESLKAKLIKYRDNNPHEFIYNADVNENLHTLAAYEPAEQDLKKIFNHPVHSFMKINEVPELAQYVKRFFINYGTKLNVSNDLMTWAGVSVPVSNVPIVSENNANAEEETEEEVEDESLVDNEPFIQEFDTNAVAINELSTYNFSGNYTISYEELGRMCINQARKSYVSSKTRDMENQKAETERRDKLYAEINKYFDLAEIRSDYASAKLDQLSIMELEQLQKQCEGKFDMLKTKDMIKHALVVIETGYNSLLPNGIPLGKSRRWIIDKGVTNSISKALFDVRTVPGHAFRRILDKHHIHLSDEISVLLEILKILMKGSHIVRNDEDIDEEEEENEEDIDEEDEEEELEEIDFE